MIDRLANAYAVVYAIIYLYIAAPVRRWYIKHRRDADYFAHMGWLVGFLVSIMMILWGIAK